MNKSRVFLDKQSAPNRISLTIYILQTTTKRLNKSEIAKFLGY